MPISRIPGVGLDTGSSGVAPSNLSTGGPYWDSSGNVGIGTSSPASRMHLSGNDGTGPAMLKITNTTASATRNIAVNNSNQIVFERAGVATDVVIDSSGNLLVGRTSTIGSSRFVVEQDTTISNPMAVSNPKSAAGSDYAIIFYRNGSIVGSIQTTLSATSYGTSSDYRLKENVQPMTGALAKVEALKPCTYQWKSDGTSSQGFIAHELAEVVPECVTGEKDAVNEDGSIKPQGIDTSFLVATLTAAIQEQQQMIETLQAKVAALEAK